jgi:hypothetical protein
MRPDPSSACTDVQQLRHDALVTLTVIQGQTQLLQRQLQRMGSVSDGHHQRLDTGLGTILEAVRMLCPLVDQLATIALRRDER